MKKNVLFAVIAFLLATCTQHPKFELMVNIQGNKSLLNKKLIINQMIDGIIFYADTIKIKKEQFLLELPYKGTSLMNVYIPESNINNIMMAGEDGKIELNIDGIKAHISGSPINDRLQFFYQENDSVSQLFKQLEEEYQIKTNPNALTSQKRDEYIQKRTKLLIENTDRTIAFIKENVDNPVGEYFFMTHYITFPQDRKSELNSFATEKLKKAFKIQ